MFTLTTKNLLAAIYSAFFAILYLAVLWERPMMAEVTLGEWHTALVLVATCLSAAISSWILFPFLGRAVGLRGVIADLALMLLAVVAASAMAGTFVMPGFGFLAGPMVVLMGAMSDIRLTALLLIGTILALTLARGQTADDR